MKPVNDRFWAKVNKTDGCWEWTAAKNRKGYGQIRVNSALYIAHRLSYAEHYGDIPKDMVVMHTCDNPSCVRPEHLQLGTLADNNRDRAKKGRSANTFGENNPHSKLTAWEVRLIRELYKEGAYTYRSLGNKFGVDQSLIGLIINNKVWVQNV